MAWTEKMVEDLKIMWKQGLTTGEIGKRLGVSKNSIVGKVHRLQLDARPSPIKKKDEQPATENVSRPAAEPAPEKTKEKKADKKDLPHSEASVSADRLYSLCRHPTGPRSRRRSENGRHRPTDRSRQPHLPLAAGRSERRKFPLLRQKSKNRPDILRRTCRSGLYQTQ